MDYPDAQPANLSRYQLREMREMRGLTPAQVEVATGGQIDIDLVLDLERGIGKFAALTPSQREAYWSLLQPAPAGVVPTAVPSRARRKRAAEPLPVPHPVPVAEDRPEPLVAATSILLRQEAQQHYHQAIDQLEQALRKFRLAAQLDQTDPPRDAFIEGTLKVLKHLE
jgi:hypothetical protein